MAITPLTVTIDLNPSYKKIPAVYVSQLDNNLRSLAITVKDGGVNYDVASSGYDVYIEGTKPDYKGFSYEVTEIGGTIVGSVITVPMQTQMTCVKGMVSTEIVLKSGVDRIGSANFLLVVERAGLAEDVDVSETDIPGYINGAQQAAATAVQAKDDAVAAKDTAVSVAASIHADYTTLSNDVDDLKSAITQEIPSNIYPEMAVGALMSEEYETEQMPYLYRISGGGVEVGKVEADTIVGGSIAWNQVTIDGNFSISSPVKWSRAGNRGTITLANNELTYTVISVGANKGDNRITQTHQRTAGHKILTTAEVYGNSNIGIIGITQSQKAITPNTWTRIATIQKETNETTINIGVDMTGSSVGDTYKVRNAMEFDLTQMFGTTIADYIYSLETATAGAGVAFFRSLFPNAYYPYNTGELMHVTGVSEHITTGKNLLDMASIEAGVINQTTGENISGDGKRSGFIRVAPYSTYVISGFGGGTIRYFLFDANKTYLNINTTTNTTISTGEAHYIRIQGETTMMNRTALQLEYGSTATAYEPYTEPYSYPLDSSLTLRGVPQLDDSNNIYWDGDTYEADGTVTRKYGIADLGSLAWEATSVTSLYRAQMTIRKVNTTGINTVCETYASVNASLSGSDMPDKSVKGGLAGGYQDFIYIKDSSYTDAATFQSAMNGVYLVYELATPTTETAEPYEEYQHVTNGGTEEYVSTGIVPVGHTTRYYGDIGTKVDGLPSDFSTIIAPTETSYVATQNYTTNELVIVNNILYKVTANIASGGTITPNTNVTQTTLSALIKALSA